MSTPTVTAAPPPEPIPADETATPETTSVEVRGLTRRYGRLTAIHDLNFAVRTGEIVGFLGPNGAGKSTTMRILCGIIPATSGEAWVAGSPVSTRRSDVLRNIGYMAENNPLPEDMRVGEYLHFRGRIKGLSGATLRQRLEEVMEVCDLARPARRKLIGTLSKGFRQRVGVADAILANPRIIILDEPTIGLDPHQVIMMRELIGSLRGKMTVIISSHILAEIELICDRVIIVNQGHLVAHGTPADLRRQFDVARECEIEAAGPRETILETVASMEPHWNLLTEDAEDGPFVRYRFACGREATRDSDERLIATIVAHPELRLRACRPREPNLEDIFLTATRRERRGTASPDTREPDGTERPGD